MSLPRHRQNVECQVHEVTYKIYVCVHVRIKYMVHMQNTPWQHPLQEVEAKEEEREETGPVQKNMVGMLSSLIW